MTIHGALSIIANVKAGMEDGLAKLLNQIENNPGGNPLIPFSKIKSIHFARIVICPYKPDVLGNPVPRQLVFTTNYDNPLSNHIEQLIEFAGPGLWQVFSFCENFPGGDFGKAPLINFITSNSKKANTFYVGVGNRSVDQIRMENELRSDIEKYLDLNYEILIHKNPKEIREDIKHYIFSSPGSTWVKSPDPLSTPGYVIRKILDLALAIFVFLIFSPVIIPFALVWWLIILFIELTEANEKCSINKKHLESLLIREKGIVQNQFSAYGNVKPGWFRYHTLLFLLKLTDFLAPYLFSKGSLSGIPTVHFARWLVISEGKQLLFLSNYDGNSEGYLRDFIDIAAKQLTLLFSHTEGYPRTWLMIFGGAKDAEGFMEWARQSQIITNVWYSANPSVSVKNIFQNSKIRNGLYGDMNEKQCSEWLKLF